MFRRKQSGFTLIELLVVIAIIGVLSSLILTGLSTARSKSRDSRRKLDLKQMEIALELHYSTYGSYTQPENWAVDCSTGASSGSTCGSGNDWDATSDLRDIVTNGYMPYLPVDPINDATYKYTYEPLNVNEPTTGKPAGQGYNLCAALESGGTYCITQRK